MRYDCFRACGKIDADERLACDMDRVEVAADDESVVGSEDLSHVFKSFVETRRAMMVVVMGMLRCMMCIVCCSFVVCE